jgi:hypothetical protein
MIDAEVMRLRRLRNTVLRARAIAAALRSGSVPGTPVFSRSALTCWRIARVITGWLRAHPYLSYQQDPSELRSLYDRISADLLARAAHYRGRSLHFFSDELRRVARELDDARALTWSPDLSDNLGRSQTQIRDLLKELDGGVRAEADSHETIRRAEARTSPFRGDAGRHADSGVAGNWPYLAI